MLRRVSLLCWITFFACRAPGTDPSSAVLEEPGPATEVERSPAGDLESGPLPGPTSVGIPDMEPSPADAEPNAPSSVPYEYVEGSASPTRLYPRREEMVVESIVETEAGIVVTLQSELPEFSHFSVAVDREAPRVVTGGEVIIELVDRHAPFTQWHFLQARAHTKDGRAYAPRRLELTYHPPSLYEANGRTSVGAITIDYTEIPRLGGHVRDWVLDEPSPAEIVFARETWGSQVDLELTPTAKAQALARALLDDLDPHRGIPSDQMGGFEPFEQYRRAVEGRDHVWCENLSKIFVRAAVSLGIPARMIAMPGYSTPTTSGLPVFWADGHLTTEIFDELQNRWIWLDLTFSALGAELVGLGPVHVASLNAYVSEPDSPGILVLDNYDVTTGSVIRSTLSHSQAGAMLMRFFNRDQRYVYLRRLPPEPRKN